MYINGLNADFALYASTHGETLYHLTAHVANLLHRSHLDLQLQYAFLQGHLNLEGR